MTTEQINSIIVQFDIGNEYFVWQMSNDRTGVDEEDRLEEFYNDVILQEHINDEDDEKMIALMELTGDNWDDAESAIYVDYKVLTDSEANEENNYCMDNYIDDCVLPQIPSHLHMYFDIESFKEDMSSDRGSNIAAADGEENEITINETTYYIYKV